MSRCRHEALRSSGIVGRAMDRQSTFLLALALLIVAAACVSGSGWFLFVRDRRASRTVADEQPAEVQTEG